MRVPLTSSVAVMVMVGSATSAVSKSSNAMSPRAVRKVTATRKPSPSPQAAAAPGGLGRRERKPTLGRLSSACCSAARLAFQGKKGVMLLAARAAKNPSVSEHVTSCTSRSPSGAPSNEPTSASSRSERHTPWPLHCSAASAEGHSIWSHAAPEKPGRQSHSPAPVLQSPALLHTARACAVFAFEGSSNQARPVGHERPRHVGPPFPSKQLQRASLGPVSVATTTPAGTLKRADDPTPSKRPADEAASDEEVSGVPAAAAAAAAAACALRERPPAIVVTTPTGETRRSALLPASATSAEPSTGSTATPRSSCEKVGSESTRDCSEPSAASSNSAASCEPSVPPYEPALPAMVVTTPVRTSTFRRVPLASTTKTTVRAPGAEKSAATAMARGPKKVACVPTPSRLPPGLLRLPASVVTMPESGSTTRISWLPLSAT